MKIIFSTFKHWPGVVTCLENIKRHILDLYPSAEILTRDFDGPHLSFSTVKELKLNPPDFLFVGGWDDRVKTIVQNTSKKTKTILMWCSPITQIELGGEMSRFFDVWNCLENNIINYLAIPVETDCAALKIANNRVVYMPIHMNVEELKNNKIEKQENTESVCDFFCAPCPRKNLLAQIFALSHHDVKLFTNFNNSSQNSSIYIDAANRLMKKYENIGWMSREDYLKQIQKSDFSSQVSLSESFNYVAAEHMYYGIPTVLSNIIPYSGDPRINKLVVGDHQNVYEISKIFKNLLNKSFREEMSENCKQTILSYLNVSKSTLEENLTSIFNGNI